MKPSELRDKSDEELTELTKSMKEQLIRMRIAVATSRRVNTSQFSRIRRDIARIETIRSERKLGLTRE
jgi:large subunit ribosomal protein L29